MEGSKLSEKAHIHPVSQSPLELLWEYEDREQVKKALHHNPPLHTNPLIRQMAEEEKLLHTYTQAKIYDPLIQQRLEIYLTKHPGQSPAVYNEISIGMAHSSLLDRFDE